jgi:sialidase-1
VRKLAIFAVVFGWVAVGSCVYADDAAVVFRAGEDGYKSYRIPAVVVTKAGTVLAFCEGRRLGAGDSGPIDLVMKRSSDAGRTWGALQLVRKHENDTVGNPCPVIDRASGTIWLPFTQNFGGDKESQIIAGTSKSTRTVWMTRSSDDGQTWAEPMDITADVKAPDWTWYATGPGIGIQTSKGRLVVPCDHVVRDTKAKASHVFYSDDAGKTWKLGGTAAPDTNECQVAERRDGSLVLNMRNYNKANPKRRAISTSADGGATWSAVTYDEALIEPICQAGLLRVEGSLGPKGMAFSNPASTTKREAMTVRFSEDDGAAWPTSRVLFEGPSGYSCLTQLKDGKIGCLYERGENNAYETIVFERISRLSTKEHE